MDIIIRQPVCGPGTVTAKANLRRLFSLAKQDDSQIWRRSPEFPALRWRDPPLSTAVVPAWPKLSPWALTLRGRCIPGNGIDVVFESARFFGWRLPCPAVAWFPDFQHRRLPQLFSPAARWRRDLGIRMQIASGRTLMLSSESALRDCRKSFPGSAEEHRWSGLRAAVGGAAGDGSRGSDHAIQTA